MRPRFSRLMRVCVSADKLPARKDKMQQARNMAIYRAIFEQTELQTKNGNGKNRRIAAALQHKMRAGLAKIRRNKLYLQHD